MEFTLNLRQVYQSFIGLKSLSVQDNLSADIKFWLVSSLNTLLPVVTEIEKSQSNLNAKYGTLQPTGNYTFDNGENLDKYRKELDKLFDSTTSIVLTPKTYSELEQGGLNIRADVLFTLNWLVSFE